jgi:hypothetical protein
LKSLDKNISDQARIVAFMVVQSMQGRMTQAALYNGMTLSSTVGLDEKGVPYLGYAIKYHHEDRTVFRGQARNPQDQHYAFIMQALAGSVVSEICPPALREAKVGDETETIAYWKRSLTFEHDVTVVEHSERETAADPLEKVRRTSAWVGYNSKNVEIIRVSEGSSNPGYEQIERVQFVDMGPRGTVAAVIFKDTVYKPGKEKSLGDAIKDSESMRHSMSSATEGTSAVAMGSVSINDRYADTGLTSIPSLAGNRMSLSRIGQVEKEIMEATAGTGAVEEVMYKGMRVVLPKVLIAEEFNALNNEAKNQYLGQIDNIVKLTMGNGFSIEKDDSETYQKLIDLLKRFVESGIFLDNWKKNYIAKADSMYHELRTLPYYTARSVGMFDAMFERLGSVPKFLKLEELKILRPDLKHMGARGETGPSTGSNYPKVLTKKEYDELSPEQQRAYFDDIQVYVRAAAQGWFGEATYQVPQEDITFLRDVLYSDVFSDGWENFIAKATPDHRFSKTYYTAQALGLSDDFLERLIGQYVKFEPDEVAVPATTKHMQAGLDAHRAKTSQPKAPARKPRAAAAVKTTAAKKPAAKKAEVTTVKAPAKRSTSKAASKK